MRKILLNNWSAIVAIAFNKVIGNKEQIPWNINSDRDWFKKKIADQSLVFGRKTFETMKILNPKNKYFVLTNDKNYYSKSRNVKVIHNISEIPKNLPDNKQIWICGGAQIYEQTLAYCKFLFITTVKKIYKGDSFFPEFNNLFTLKENIYEDNIIKIQKFINNRHGGN